MNGFVALGAALLALTTPGSARVEHGLVYEPGPRGTLDVYMPAKPSKDAPIAVFFYGGSWQSGQKAIYRFVGEALASRGIVTVIPDYRVYPEVRYPDFLRDNARAVAFARRHAAEWGASTGPVFLIGHSAGAYNAAMLAVDPRWLGEAGLSPENDVAGLVGLAGPYDFLPLKDDTLKTIFGPEDQRPDTQPINHVSATAPPMLLLAGAKDSVVDPGNATRLAKAARERGATATAEILPGYGHVGLATSLSGLFRGRGRVLDEIATFVRANGQGRMATAEWRAPSPQTLSVAQ